MVGWLVVCAHSRQQQRQQHLRELGSTATDDDVLFQGYVVGNLETEPTAADVVLYRLRTTLSKLEEQVTRATLPSPIQQTPSRAALNQERALERQSALYRKEMAECAKSNRQKALTLAKCVHWWRQPALTTHPTTAGVGSLSRPRSRSGASSPTTCTA